MPKVKCSLCSGKKEVSCEYYGLEYGTTDHRDVTLNGPCPMCGGSGKIRCPECHGRGTVEDD